MFGRETRHHVPGVAPGVDLLGRIADAHPLRALGQEDLLQYRVGVLRLVEQDEVRRQHRLGHGPELQVVVVFESEFAVTGADVVPRLDRIRQEGAGNVVLRLRVEPVDGFHMPRHHLPIGAVTEPTDHAHHQARLVAAHDRTGIDPQVPVDTEQPRGLLRGDAGGGVQARLVRPPDGLVRQRMRGPAVDIGSEAPAGVFGGCPVESHIQPTPAGGTGHQNESGRLAGASPRYQGQLPTRHEHVPRGELLLGRIGRPGQAGANPPGAVGADELVVILSVPIRVGRRRANGGVKEVGVRTEPCPQRVLQATGSALMLRDPPARVGQPTEDQPNRPGHARVARPRADQFAPERGGACDLIRCATGDRG
jgi:hypothetical protein